MKKIALPIFICAILFALLTSCGIPKPPNEARIANSLPNDLTTVIIANPFDAMDSDVYEMNIKAVIVEKRQTNEKSDIAYCWVILENEYYRFTKYLKLNYNYYEKGGWILDDYSEYAPTEWEVLDVPFEEDDVALVLNYDVNTPVTVNSYLSSGTVEYSFPIEEIHKNVTYRGTAIVECTFNGTAWMYDVDASGVDVDWNVARKWEYITTYDSGSFSGLIRGCQMEINNVSQYGVATGVCRYYYPDLVDGLGVQKSRDYNLADARLEFTESAIIAKWSDSDIVYIRPDVVSCEFVFENGRGCKLKLDSEEEYAEEGTSREIPQELSSVIDQYFKIVKNGTSDDAIRLSLIQAFPNFYGDGLIDDLLYAQYVLGENIMDGLSYEIVAANQYSMRRADSQRMWATAMEEEFYVGPADPDAYAEILVKLTIEAPNSSMDGEVIYCDTILVQDNGTWGIFGIGNNGSERPQMIFPF